MHVHSMRFLWFSAAVLAGAALFAERVPKAVNAADQVPTSRETSTPVTTITGAASEIVRGADSHFYVNAQVNGATIRMLIDTGASIVALTRADALAAGIAAGPGEFSAEGVGVGGTVRLKPVTIDRLAVGSLAANAVPAVVVEDTLPVSLLGQSYLSRLTSVEIKGDRLVLR